VSRIDELIRDLCHDGVPHFAVRDIGTFVSGLAGKTKADFSEGNARFISYRNVYGNLAVNQTAGDFVRVGDGERQNELRLGDVLFTGSSETPDDVGMSSVILEPPQEPLYLNSFCFCLRPADPDLLLPGYSKYIFRSARVRREIAKAASGVTRFNISKGRFAEIKIPVPSLEVQREIARVLDLFTTLEAELEAELEARRRQYAHYRDSLLTFRDARGVRWAPMGEMGQFIRGRRFTKADVVQDGIPSIHYGEIYTQYGVAADETVSHVRCDLASQLRYAKPGDVVIAAVGETVEDVGKAVAWLGHEDVAIHDDCFFYRHSMNPKYVSYYLQTDEFHSQKGRHVARAKVKRLSAEGLARITIPVPALQEQQRIVAILDKFDVLVNDLSIGLPAELVARRKQYEYYRGRLLTFDEAVA
jgi:type I restriction enzyme S subunit